LAARSARAYLVRVSETRHEPERRRFVLQPDGGGEAVLEYALSPGVVDFHHTYVPPVARGRGVAERLVRDGLAWARSEDLRVIPSCSYVASYLRRHPEEASR
jgi:predicted GNAT family acetyltransferase